MTSRGLALDILTAGRTLSEPRVWGDGVGFLSIADGVADLCWVPLAGGEPLVLARDVARAHPTGGGVWSALGSRAVVFDRKGACWSVAAPDVAAPAGGVAVEEPRMLIPGPASDRGSGEHRGEVASPTLSPDGRWLLFVEDMAVLCVVRADGEGPTVRFRPGADFVLDPVWGPSGSIVAWHAWDVPHMAFDESRIEAAAWDGTEFGPVTVLAGGAGVAVAQPRFDPSGRWLGYLSDASGFMNVELAEVDRGAAALGVAVSWRSAREVGRSTWGPGQRAWTWARLGPDVDTAPDVVVALFNDRAFGSLERLDLQGPEAPEVVARAWWYGLDARGSAVVGVRSGARTPPEIAAVDVVTGTRRSLLTSFGEGVVDRDELVEPEIVSCPSRSGPEVVARLYRPLPSRARSATICLIHGGPNGQRAIEWDAPIAYWVSRGFDVLVPDYRGSSGHGRAFAQALRHEWGRADVTDCAAVLDHAHSIGAAPAGRVILMGASSAGLTIFGLCRRDSPVRALLAGAAVSFGVCDLVALQESTYRFEGHYLDGLIGSWPQVREEYVRRSPLSWCTDIDVPALILQGSADIVVPPGGSRAMATSLLQLGRDVEYHEFPGEGHGWRRSATVRDSMMLTERFLERVLSR